MTFDLSSTCTYCNRNTAPVREAVIQRKRGDSVVRVCPNCEETLLNDPLGLDRERTRTDRSDKVHTASGSRA